jgi:hypothetical protein
MGAGLETFSFGFAKRLLECHPELLPFVTPIVSEQEGVQFNTLAINLPLVNPSIVEPLTITVDLNKIVAVSWFPYMGHFALARRLDLLHAWSPPSP